MLEPGTHEVTMLYSSPWLRIGVMGSALSALVLALFLVGFTLVSRRRAAAAS
jgi:hypothetical protein